MKIFAVTSDCLFNRQKGRLIYKDKIFVFKEDIRISHYKIDVIRLLFVKEFLALKVYRNFGKSSDFKSRPAALAAVHKNTAAQNKPSDFRIGKLTGRPVYVIRKFPSQKFIEAYFFCGGKFQFQTNSPPSILSFR